LHENKHVERRVISDNSSYHQTPLCCCHCCVSQQAWYCHCCVSQQAWYCNTTCQQTGWRIHKNTCKQLRLAAALQQAEQRLCIELGLPEQQQQQEQQQQEAAAAAEFGSSFSAYPTAAELAAAVPKPEQVGHAASVTRSASSISLLQRLFLCLQEWHGLQKMVRCSVLVWGCLPMCKVSDHVGCCDDSIMTAPVCRVVRHMFEIRWGSGEA
jgi:hypothetical protein